jgi:hypothetical protein
MIAKMIGLISVPEEWVTTFVVGIIAAIGGVWLKAKSVGKVEGETSREVTIKNQPLQMTKTDRPVSFDQHSALDARVARIEIHLDRIERDRALQYKQLLEAGSERELRMTEVLAQGLREVHSRLDALLTRQAPNPPRR